METVPFTKFIFEAEGGMNPVACQKSKVYGPIVVTCNSTNNLGKWIKFRNCLNQLTIANHHFTFEYFYSRDAKVIAHVLISDHIHPSQFVSTIEPTVVPTF